MKTISHLQKKTTVSNSTKPFASKNIFVCIPTVDGRKKIINPYNKKMENVKDQGNETPYDWKGENDYLEKLSTEKLFQMAYEDISIPEYITFPYHKKHQIETELNGQPTYYIKWENRVILSILTGDRRCVFISPDTKEVRAFDTEGRDHQAEIEYLQSLSVDMLYKMSATQMPIPNRISFPEIPDHVDPIEHMEHDHPNGLDTFASYDSILMDRSYRAFDRHQQINA